MQLSEQDSSATGKLWSLLLKLWIGLAAIFGVLLSLVRGPEVSNLKVAILTVGLTTFVIGVAAAGVALMIRYCAPRKIEHPIGRRDDV